MPAIMRRRAAFGGIEGREQLTTAESSNGTCQRLVVEPFECMKDCLARTVINKGQAIGDTLIRPSFPPASESTPLNVGPCYIS